jgi:hypothetical protein
MTMVKAGIGDQTVMIIVAFDGDVELADIPKLKVLVMSGHQVVLLVRIVID